VLFQEEAVISWKMATFIWEEPDLFPAGGDFVWVDGDLFRKEASFLRSMAVLPGKGGIFVPKGPIQQCHSGFGERRIPESPRPRLNMNGKTNFG